MKMRLQVKLAAAAAAAKKESFLIILIKFSTRIMRCNFNGEK
jgi:hypothetical protein